MLEPYSKDFLSAIYLTGMNERNYFDARAEYFTVHRENTEEQLENGGVYLHDDQAEQALVHPVLDHNFIVDRSVAGGELAFESKLTSVKREKSDIRHPLGF